MSPPAIPAVTPPTNAPIPFQQPGPPVGLTVTQRRINPTGALRTAAGPDGAAMAPLPVPLSGPVWVPAPKLLSGAFVPRADPLESDELEPDELEPESNGLA